MRRVELSAPAPQPGDGRLPRLTRHLAARLEDFAPGGPQVLTRDEHHGRVTAVFPGRDTAQVLSGLAGMGVFAGQEGEQAVFYLAPQTRFEDLDYVWGCLSQLLE